MKLKHIIQTDIVMASSEDLVLQLCTTMREKKISSIVIKDENYHPVGIFTESDVIKIVAKKIDLNGVKVKEFIYMKQLFVVSVDEAIAKAFELMEKTKCRHIIAVDDSNHIQGIATQSDFLKYFDTQALIRQKVVADVMTQRVQTIAADKTIHDGANLMMQKGVSSLVITDKNGYAIGIVTERDMLEFAPRSQKRYQLESVMSKPLKTLNPSHSLIEALEFMHSCNIRRVVVQDGEKKLVGIVTRHDILKAVQEKKVDLLAQTIKQKNYEIDVIYKQDTDLKLLDTALKASESAVVITGSDASVLWCNRAFETLTGYQKDEILHQKIQDLVKSNKQSKTFYRNLWSTILAKKSFRAELVNRKKDGTLYEEKITITPIVDNSDTITHFVAIKEDISHIRQLQTSLKESQRRFKSLFENAPMPYQSLDSRGYIVAVNRAWLEFSEYSYDEVIGRYIGEFLPQSQQDILQTMFQEFLQVGSISAKVLEFTTKNGKHKTIEINGKLAKDHQDQKVYTHCLIYDVTEKKAMQDRIYNIAHYDRLTGLPNRVSLNSEITHALAKSDKSGYKVALFVLGLDRFKDINDSFGHKVGDELLQKVASKIKQVSKDEDFIARVVGDQFAILVEGALDEDECAIKAQKYIDAINKTWELESGLHLYINATLGIAVYPTIARSSAQLFQYADAALFLAKRENRGRFRFYNEQVTKEARKNIATITALKASIVKEEFTVLYQPQVDIQTGKVIGCESLVRWNKGSKLISPTAFISLAEDRGLISAITELVLRQSCEDLHSFLPFCSQDFKLSINLSSTQLHQKMLQKVADIVDSSGVCYKNLGIEVTESIFINDISRAVQTLKGYKRKEFLISLDDFGTGYSSLSYLKQLPIDILKIDKSFVDGVDKNNDDTQIAKTIISMAKTMGLKVLAEGVEDKKQLQFLNDHECDYYQGYFFSKPVTADRFEKIVQNQI